jgi:preprotein translocase subunit SecD
MSEPSPSGGCSPLILALLAAIFGSFMAAFSTSSSTLVSPTEIVTHVTFAPIGTFTTDELEQAETVISKRLTGLGLSTATVEIIDSKTISVGLPQIEDLDDVVKTLSARGLLEFVGFSDVPDIGDWTGRDILTTGQGDHPVSDTASKNPVTNAPFETVLTGEGVQSAVSSFNQDYGGQWQVTVKFSDEAGRVLGEYTHAHIGKPLAIVLDGKVLSVPVIQAEISTEAVIAGNFTEQETKRLAVQLGSGALPFAMEAQIFRVSVLRGDFGMSISTATSTIHP